MSWDVGSAAAGSAFTSQEGGWGNWSGETYSGPALLTTDEDGPLVFEGPGTAFANSFARTTPRMRVGASPTAASPTGLFLPTEEDGPLMFDWPGSAAATKSGCSGCGGGGSCSGCNGGGGCSGNGCSGGCGGASPLKPQKKQKPLPASANPAAEYLEFHSPEPVAETGIGNLYTPFGSRSAVATEVGDVCACVEDCGCCLTDLCVKVLPYKKLSRDISYQLYWEPQTPKAASCEPKCKYWMWETSFKVKPDQRPPEGYKDWKWGEWNSKSQHYDPGYGGASSVEVGNARWAWCQDKYCREGQMPDWSTGGPFMKKGQVLRCSPYTFIDTPAVTSTQEVYQYIIADTGLKGKKCKRCCALLKLTLKPSGDHDYEIIAHCEKTGGDIKCQAPPPLAAKLAFTDDSMRRFLLHIPSDLPPDIPVHWGFWYPKKKATPFKLGRGGNKSWKCGDRG